MKSQRKISLHNLIQNAISYGKAKHEDSVGCMQTNSHDNFFFSPSMVRALWHIKWKNRSKTHAKLQTKGTRPTIWVTIFLPLLSLSFALCAAFWHSAIRNYLKQSIKIMSTARLLEQSEHFILATRHTQVSMELIHSSFQMEIPRAAHCKCFIGTDLFSSLAILAEIKRGLYINEMESDIAHLFKTHIKWCINIGPNAITELIFQKSNLWFAWITWTFWPSRHSAKGVAEICAEISLSQELHTRKAWLNKYWLKKQRLARKFCYRWIYLVRQSGRAKSFFILMLVDIRKDKSLWKIHYNLVNAFQWDFFCSFHVKPIFCRRKSLRTLNICHGFVCMGQ